MRTNNKPSDSAATFHGGTSRANEPMGRECSKCGARRIDSQLGLERTPEEFIANMVAVFREVWRVLKPDGTIWVNIGDSYNANQGAGFNAHSKTRPHLSGEGVGQKRLDESNRNTKLEIGLKPKNLVGIPWRLAFALQADGWYLRSDIIWHKPNPMPESVTDRPTKAHEYLFLLAKGERYFYDAEAISEPATHAGKVVSLGEKSFSKGQANGMGVAASGNGTASSYEVVANRNRRTVWTIATQPYSGAHFATFPEALVEPCILAGSIPGDYVLDPFVGSGTVIRVATRHQRKGVGCDINLAYLSEQAKRRTRNVQVQMAYT